MKKSSIPNFIKLDTLNNVLEQIVVVSDKNENNTKNVAEKKVYISSYEIESLSAANTAELLEKKGVFSIVIECVETSLSKQITKTLKIPTIGFGSSQNCDGQVLVVDDLIGLNESKIKFVKKFGQVKNNISQAAKSFKNDVLNKKYPSKKYSY